MPADRVEAEGLTSRTMNGRFGQFAARITL
jgi:hypothetical protein